MSKKYIIKHIKGELLNNFLAKPNKPADILGMEHDYCKTTECSTLVDHYDECFKRISTVKFENKSDLISNDDSNVNCKFETTIDDTNEKNYFNDQNIEVRSEVILYDNDSTDILRQTIENKSDLFINNEENDTKNIVESSSINNSFHQNEVDQIEIDSACQSIITNLHNDSITKTNIKPRTPRNITQSIILPTANDPVSTKNLEELQLLLRQDNSTTEFIPNQLVHYESYQEAVDKNDGKTTKKKCFKNCKYEEGQIHITREEIQTYNKCKKHILLKDFLKLLIWKKFPSVNNVCHFNISSVNIAPRTGYTIYAYCKFLSCNNFRIVIRQSSLSLIGFVYKSRLEPLHYENVPLVEQVRGLKRKLLGPAFENIRKDPFWEWTDQNVKEGNVFSRKRRKNNKNKKQELEEEKQLKDEQLEQLVDEVQEEEELEPTDENILNSTEVHFIEEEDEVDQVGRTDEEIYNISEVQMEEVVDDEEQMERTDEEIFNSTELLEEEVDEEEQVERIDEEILNCNELQLEEEVDEEEQMEEILNSTEIHLEEVEVVQINRTDEEILNNTEEQLEEIDDEEQMERVNEEILYSTEIII